MDKYTGKHHTLLSFNSVSLSPIATSVENQAPSHEMWLYEHLWKIESIFRALNSSVVV